MPDRDKMEIREILTRNREKLIKEWSNVATGKEGNAQ
jgi:hypothetical protein